MSTRIGNLLQIRALRDPGCFEIYLAKVVCRSTLWYTNHTVRGSCCHSPIWTLAWVLRDGLWALRGYCQREFQLFPPGYRASKGRLICLDRRKPRGFHGMTPAREPMTALHRFKEMDLALTCRTFGTFWLYGDGHMMSLSCLQMGSALRKRVVLLLTSLQNSELNICHRCISIPICHILGHCSFRNPVFSSSSQFAKS